MRNRRLTRAERERNARILNNIVDLPINHQDHSILAYGRPPFPLKDKLDEAPQFPRLRVSAFENSPAAHPRWWEKSTIKPEPLLASLLLVLCSLLLVLSITTKVIAK